MMTISHGNLVQCVEYHIIISVMTAGQYLSFKHKLFKPGLYKPIYSKANDSSVLFVCLFFLQSLALVSLFIMFKYMDNRSVQFFGPMDYFLS